ncbi:MAG TPA: UDP-3-O-(3-hydroxymyristoyl)glucosamine N-acyltransferase [Abditibacteriaceae bacterium]|jgi:UDP-3-O-[3-hydroxymyristoyl] glucosamine N-acyltransferase
MAQSKQNITSSSHHDDAVPNASKKASQGASSGTKTLAARRKAASPNSSLDSANTVSLSDSQGATNGSPRGVQLTLGDIARLLNAEFIGDAETVITGVASLDTAGPGALAFVEHDSRLQSALDSQASALIVPSGSESTLRDAQLNAKTRTKPAVLSGNPRLAFARVMEFFQPAAPPEKGVHPTAVIDPTAIIGDNVTIREFCYIGRHARIGAGTVIYPHVTVGDGAQIGENCVVFPSVVIGHHVCIGARVRIHSGTILGGDGFGYVIDEKGNHYKVPQVGTVIIEEDVEIGANVCIDRATMGATRVGSGSKIDNLVQIAHNVQIGRNCILCGQSGLSGSVEVGDGAILAGQAGSRDHVKIGKGAIVGAKSGVMDDVPDGEFVAGTPALPGRQRMKLEAAFRKMPDTSKTVRELEKQVKAMQEQMEVLRSQIEKTA